MRPRAFALAFLAALVFLLAFNALLFPLLFPGGPAHAFAHPRPQPLLGLNALALTLTAGGLTLLCGALGGGGVSGSALLAGVAGLLASLPSGLHAGAVTTDGFHLGPVLFTTASWTAAGALIGWIAGARVH